MPLTQDRETQNRAGEILELPVAAATTIFGGGLNAVNADGNIVPAADAAGLKVVGVAEAGVDNSAGANGDKMVKSRRKRAFKLKNSAANPVTAAHLLTDVYVEDDETVSASGGTNSIIAGKCLGIDADGVWTEI